MVVRSSAFHRADLQLDIKFHFGDNPIIFITDVDCRLLAHLSSDRIVGGVRERECGFSHRHLQVFDFDTAFISQTGAVISGIKKVPRHVVRLRICLRYGKFGDWNCGKCRAFRMLGFDRSDGF